MQAYNGVSSILSVSFRQLQLSRQPLPAPRIITLIGGGGKTSLMFLWARCLREQGFAVVTTTTTKMCNETPPGFRITPAATLAAAQAILQKSTDAIPLLISEYLASENKLAGIPADWVDSLGRDFPATFFLVEGDGSAGRSLKAHLPHEPVVPAATMLLAPVIGLDVLGKPLEARYVHRPKLFAERVGMNLGEPINPDAILKILFGSKGYLAKAPKTAAIIPFLNKLDTLPNPEVGCALARQILAIAHPQISSVWIGSVQQNHFMELS